MEKRTSNFRVLRIKELTELLQVTRQCIWVWEREGKFPRRFKIAKGSKAVGWLESDIREWLEEQSAKANQPVSEEIEK